MNHTKALVLFLLIAAGMGFASCKNQVSQASALVLYSDGTTDGSWNFTDGKYFYSLDSKTLDYHQIIKLDTFVSRPVCTGNKVYLGDQGKSVGQYGSSVFVFDDDFCSSSCITAIPNIRYLVQDGRFIIADSMCYYGSNKSGFAVIDTEKGSEAYESREAPEIICNEGYMWSYGGSFILAFSRNGEKIDIRNLSIKANEDGTYSVEENPSFMSLQSYEEEGSYSLTIDGSKAFVTFKKSHVIYVFDLESETLLKKIDLEEKLDLDELTLLKPQVMDDFLYLLTDGEKGSIISLNLEDWSIKAVETDICLKFTLDYSVFASYPSSIFIHTLGEVSKLSLATGKTEAILELTKSSS